MARHDHRMVGGGVDGVLGPDDGGVDAAAVLVIDEWVVAVPEGVAQGQHVGVLQVDPQVAVGVAFAEVLHLDLLTAKLHALAAVDDDGWARFLWQRGEGVIPVVDAGRLRQVGGGHRRADDGGAGGVHPGVAVRVVPVVVGVDQVFEGGRADVVQGGGQLVFRDGDAGVDDEFALRAVVHDDVAARAGQHADIAAQGFYVDVGLGGGFIDLEHRAAGIGGAGRAQPRCACQYNGSGQDQGTGQGGSGFHSKLLA